MNYLDLTHTFTKEMPVYPGDPIPELIQIAAVEKDGYTDFQIKTGMHVGTHIDAPLHMLKDGKRLSEIVVNKFVGRGHIIDARGKPTIEVDLLNGKTIMKDDIVIVMTGFYEKFWQPEYYEKYPEISEDFAKRMVEFGVKVVGMDTPSPDRAPFEIHKLLLRQEILIIENLTNLLSLLNVSNFEIIALPAKFDTEAAPVRVVARIE